MSEGLPRATDALLAKAVRTLAAARSVFENGFFDDASSRAYYAAFHAASAVLAGRGLFFSPLGRRARVAGDRLPRAVADAGDVVGALR